MLTSDDLFLSESEITFENLIRIFNEASLDARVTPDDQLRVQTDNLIVYVRILEDIQLLRFYTWFRFADDVSIEAKCAFVNDLNNQTAFVRFSFALDDDEALCCDYFLPYRNGVAIWSIIVALGHLESAVVQAIKEHKGEFLQ